MGDILPVLDAFQGWEGFADVEGAGNVFEWVILQDHIQTHDKLGVIAFRITPHLGHGFTAVFRHLGDKPEKQGALAWWGVSDKWGAILGPVFGVVKRVAFARPAREIDERGALVEVPMHKAKVRVEL